MKEEQILMEKWQSLTPEKKEQIWTIINSLEEKKATENVFQPQTKLGQELWEIRKKIVANSQIKLLSMEEIESELNEIRKK